jgi:hypothetical protein
MALMALHSKWKLKQWLKELFMKEDEGLTQGLQNLMLNRIFTEDML